MLDVDGETIALNIGAIRRRLTGGVVGAHVYVFGDVSSTNAVLREMADAGAEEGTVVLADSQHAGRGRLDSVWFSPPGVNLYVSALLRPSIAPSEAPIFSFIASLALTEAVGALGVAAGVKWPNDVLAAGRKLAGTRLDVATGGGRVTYIVVGVGVNVNIERGELAEGLGAAAADATSLREELGHRIDRNALASAFFNHLEKWLAVYRAEGPDAIVKAWRAWDVLTGRRVLVSPAGGDTFAGRVVGVDARGFLLVDDDEGTRHTVVSGAIRSQPAAPPRREGRPLRVLLATDGSNDAKAAADWLAHLPVDVDREVLVLTAVAPTLLPAVPDALSDLRGARLADARRLADDTASALLVGRTATGRVVEGDPREEIVSSAEGWNADLVVVGARGLGAVKSVLLGSVSLAVARHAPCPVLVCKGSPRPVRHVTIALDGSDHARRALAWFAGLPLPKTLRTRLLGVIQPQHFPSMAPGIVREPLRVAVAALEEERRAVLAGALDAAAEPLRARVALVETVVATGSPAEVIVGDAERHGSDLIVVGARGLGVVNRLLLGSVSESVVSHAQCPVLIVRAKRSDAPGSTPSR